MTISSGMRSRRLRVPTSLQDGGTGARTRAEAVKALEVPSLDGDNTFTGVNTFDGRLLVDTVQAVGDLTFLTTDVFNFQDGGGTNYVEFLGASRSLAFPDASGTLALVGGAIQWPYKAQGSVYAASRTDGVINCSGTFTVTLPTAVGFSGQVYVVKNSGGGTVTVAGTGGQTFDGAASVVLAASAVTRVCSDGANWLII